VKLRPDFANEFVVEMEGETQAQKRASMRV